jgi:RNA polymerase sigma-70 factor, ECF subfamily
MKLASREGYPMFKKFSINPLNVIEEEYEKNYSYLKHFLLKLTRDEQLSEDIIQEVFSRMLRNPEKILEVKYIRTWLVSVAKNLVIDHYRKKKPSLMEDGEIISDLLVDTSNPEGLMIQKETIFNALSNIPKLDKTIFLAKEHYGYKYDEIASLLDMPVSSIKSRLFRVRKKILANLERGESDG